MKLVFWFKNTVTTIAKAVKESVTWYDIILGFGIGAMMATIIKS